MTTAVRVGDPDPTPVLDEVQHYCWAPHRLPERTAYCSWPLAHDGDHVTVDNHGVVAVYDDTSPPPGRVWSPRDRLPWVMGPDAMRLSADQWTNELAFEGRATGVNRQCSIGYHNECSDPEGESCRCACHGGDR